MGRTSFCHTGSVIFRFGDHVLDLSRVELRCRDAIVGLEPQVFDVLAYLVMNRDRLVTKEEILDNVWGDRFVSVAALTGRIAAARRAIGDDGRKQALIKTVHGRGFRFVGEVEESSATEVDAIAGEHSPRSSSFLSYELFGRHDDLAGLEDQLEAQRVITLVGPAGVGKTSLALALCDRVADRFADGVTVIELVEVTDPATAIGAVATALDAQPRQGRTSVEAVVDVMGSRQMLLLFDNCEHVVEPVTAVIRALLDAAAAVTVLATGREPLQIRDEQIWPVGPLETDEVASPGVQLFVERASAADPTFDLEKSEAAVMEICRRLDGVPLAIELAAARTRMLSVEDIASRLDERFRLLKGTRRGGDPRHQTLLDAVSWSYELLDESEQALFDRLSVFAGPFDLQVAEAVCAPDDDLNVLDALTGLVDRSMLTVRRTSLGTRFELLETLRAFGADRLPDSERIGLYRRHGAHYLEVAEKAAAGLDGPDEAVSISELDQAFVNIRAAYRFGVETDDPHLAFGLIAAMREYAFRTMRYEITTWADTSLAEFAATSSESSLQAVVKGVAAHGAFVRGEYERALSIANETRALEKEADQAPSGLAERAFVNVYTMIGPPDEALDEALRQIEAVAQSGNAASEAHALYMGAVAHASQGATDAAKLLLEQAEAAATSSGSPTALAGAAYARGLIFEAADPETALETFAVCDESSRETGNRWMSAFARTSTASILLGLGQLDAACKILADLLDIWHRAGDWSQQWLTLNQSIVALATIGDSELASQVAGAVETHAAIGAAPASAHERDRVLATVSQLQADLGPQEHEFHRNQGRERPVDDLVAAVRRRLVGHR